MPENVYRCPECGANLKMAQPVPAGKKLKCPKCQTVFLPSTGAASASAPAAPRPKPVAAAPKTAPTAAAPKPKPAADDEDAGTYGFIQEAKPPPPPKEDLDLEDDEDDSPADRKKKKAAKAKKKKEAEDPLKKTFPKGKRGPAAAAVMAPTNQLLGTSALAAVSSIVSILYAIWPIVFGEKALDDIPTRFLWMGAMTVAFVYNGVIAVGAGKMQSVESYVWAMIASVMMLLPLNWLLAWPSFYWFLELVSTLAGLSDPSLGIQFWFLTMFVVCAWYVFVGVWNVMTLQKPEVKEGFAEKRLAY
jgi:DNA-directed RNA polymerase subunit RPC12/RpoP